MDDFESRMDNAHNSHQGPWKKVLCVCSAGLLRSPTIAHVLAGPDYNCNTRACGANHAYALIKLELVLVEWADEIIVAGEDHLDPVNLLVAHCSNPKKRVICLKLPDIYKTRQQALIEAIKRELNAHNFSHTETDRITPSFQPPSRINSNSIMGKREGVFVLPGEASNNLSGV
jgi:predicted protein tyrosine phosphatase